MKWGVTNERVKPQRAIRARNLPAHCCVTSCCLQRQWLTQCTSVLWCFLGHRITQGPVQHLVIRDTKVLSPSFFVSLLITILLVRMSLLSSHCPCWGPRLWGERWQCPFALWVRGADSGTPMLAHQCIAVLPRVSSYAVCEHIPFKIYEIPRAFPKGILSVSH